MKYTGRKGWRASRKDTWSLDNTLSPIIFAGLKKFREVVYEVDVGFKSIPSSILCEVFPDHKGFEFSEEQLKQAEKVWLDYLDQMIYAFDESNEPDILEYAFSINIERGKPDTQGMIPCDLEVVGQGESDRYDKDMKKYQRDREKGWGLFAKHYQNLWW